MALAVAVAIGLGGAGYAGALDRVPLLNVRAAVVIEGLAAAALCGSWWYAGRRWLRRTLPVLLGGVAVVTALTALLLRLTGTVTDGYPVSFALWVGLAFAALAGVPLAFRARPGRRATGDRVRRLTAIVAVPLTIAGAVLLIDDQYGIWPQLGDLLGHTRSLNPAAVPGLAHPDPGRQDVTPDGSAVPSGKGVLVSLDPPATVSRFRHRPALVYLPPAYFRAGGTDLPVLVMLIGTPGTPINWIRAGGAQAAADAYAAAHRGIAPILAVVDNNGSATADTECVDGPQGNAETYLTVDVPTFLIDRLHLRPNPRGWGLVGFSEGGTCALDLMLSHPDLFRHAVDLGGDMKPTLGTAGHTLTALFGGSPAAEQAHDPLHLMAIHRYPGVSAWFAGGTDDRNAITAARRLAAAARTAGISTYQLTASGGHSWQFAATAFRKILPWLCVDLGCSTAAEIARPA